MRATKRLLRDYVSALNRQDTQRAIAANFERFKAESLEKGINIWAKGPQQGNPVDPALRPVLERLYELEEVPEGERTAEHREELARCHALLDDHNKQQPGPAKS